MHIRDIINAMADEADDFLGDVTSMTEAQPLIREYLQEHYPDLSPDDAKRVLAGLLALLNDEGFFENTGGGHGSWSEGGDDLNEE